MSARPVFHQTPRWPWPLLIAGGALGLAGYFAPWTPHPAAGLVITGLELAEYVKFLPEVMSGQIPLQREVFYTPLLAGSLIASLLSSRAALWRPARMLLALAAIMLALAQLPPAWSPAVLRLPEFSVQVLAIAMCLSIVLLTPPLRYLPDRVVLIGSSLLALGAALWPAWSFLQVRPAIAAVYHKPLSLGWGFWVCLLGYLCLAFFGVASALLPRRSPRP